MIGTVMVRTPFGGKYESQVSVQTLGGDEQLDLVNIHFVHRKFTYFT
jgi:hypothetical protein